MKTIKILGGGCAKCEQLAEHAETAAKELGLDYRLEKITDANEISEHGVMMTPALVVDDEVQTTGEVPDVETLKQYME